MMVSFFIDNNDIPRFVVAQENSRIRGDNDPFLGFWLLFGLRFACLDATVEPLPLAALDEIDGESNDIGNPHYATNDTACQHGRFGFLAGRRVRLGDRRVGRPSPVKRCSFCGGLCEDIVKGGRRT